MKKYNMREAREFAGKTQDDTAVELHTTQKQVSKWELQQQDITLQKAVIMADFYGVSLDYIAGRTNDKRGVGYENRT